MTNREWLKSLSDEELLKHIYIYCVEMEGYEGFEDCQDCITNCTECQIKWLNDEHKELGK